LDLVTMDPIDVPYTSADNKSKLALTQSKNIIISKRDSSSDSDDSDPSDSDSDDDTSSDSSENKIEQEPAKSHEVELSEVSVSHNNNTYAETRRRRDANRGTASTINNVRNRNKTIAMFIKGARQPHVYSKWEKKQMKNYESISYRNPRSEIYQQFVTSTSIKNSLLWKWFLFIIIGIIIAITSFTLKITTEKSHEVISCLLQDFFFKGQILQAYLWHLFMALSFLVIGSPLVIWFEPKACGAGIP